MNIPLEFGAFAAGYLSGVMLRVWIAAFWFSRPKSPPIQQVEQAALENGAAWTEDLHALARAQLEARLLSERYRSNGNGALL
jgi:hypothetical protein